jgi:hypothetical protein
VKVSEDIENICANILRNLEEKQQIYDKLNSLIHNKNSLQTSLESKIGKLK